MTRDKNKNSSKIFTIKKKLMKNIMTKKYTSSICG